ncbi:glycosyl hydrolase family 16 [Colletotrichum karsti]|uniref:Glycosyl hydrolase family 16 n=1 Tax=Colletotrichum karsti TaxID=1095194 RepID=A0A9P6HWR6_9PEZI|nr:glycosyl hydrolase family 16 [Colletotrichum karsti]KAF9872903.1 glycosyl hydrolase family 16 [Colletotrichum karsti]
MMRHAALSLALGLASAQTFSACNPVKGDKCPANVAFGGEANYDFRTAKSVDALESFFIVDGGVKWNQKLMSFSDDTGAQMTIFDEQNAPTLTSAPYLFFGKVEVELQAAPGRGIVTSVVLQSDALDEIDWEFVGADQNHVQTNFYALGINDYGRARYYEVDFNPMTSFHTYTIEWTRDSIVFSIDGKAYRTATPAEGNYPQTPMQLKLGTWVGGKGPNQGTIDWAGGLAEWDKAPFAAHYRSVKVWDYAGGDKAGATSYEYKPGSDGSWQTIQVNGKGEYVGDVNRDGQHKEQPRQRAPVPQVPQTASPSRAAVNATATAASNATTVTRQTSGAAAAGTGTGTGIASPSGPAQSPIPAPASASTLQAGVFIACAAGFFAAMML